MEESSYRPEYITKIAQSIQENLQQSIREIYDVHERTHVLSINARIEAARSGAHGKGFKIVAEEFSHLNNEIARISETLSNNLQVDSDKLIEISGGMARQVRGQRLSQIALSVMDVIDRNLYERTCDVRWWATDASVVMALSKNHNKDFNYASQRLGVILDSYTVYLDIVLADSEGKIVANGRPEDYSSRGNRCSEESWFEDAMNTRSGEEYTFKGTHASPLTGNRKVLVYGCQIENDQTKSGAPLGALGIFFNWEGLGKAVLDRVLHIDLHDDIQVMKLKTVISIVDRDGTVLSSSDHSLEDKPLPYKNINTILESESTGYLLNQSKEELQILAYSFSPGFETYATGWYCVISQVINQQFEI